MTRAEYFRWLDQARLVLAQSVGVELGPIQVTVAYVWTGHHVDWIIGSEEPEEGASPIVVSTDGQTDARLRVPHRRVLDVLSAEPAKSRTITRLAGFSAGSQGYVRQVLAELVRWGLARSVPGGYTRA